MSSEGSRVRARAWTIWGAALVAYFVATFQRATLAVSSIRASHRFGLRPSELSVLLVVQLLVYAGLQVPVGAALGRLGPRRLLLTGALLMSVSQLAFALSERALVAVLARLLLGAGDAMTFVSVLRLLGEWFPSRLNPLLVQLTGFVGLLGGLVSAVPLLLVLNAVGWTPTFLAASSLSLVAFGVVCVVVPKSPGPAAAQSRRELLAGARQDLAAAWGSAGTRLGQLTHFATGFPAMAFSLLWGFPLLVQGEHLSQALAATLLSVLTLASMALGPVFGHLTAAWPLRRSWLVLGTVGASAMAWAFLIAWPGRAPLALIVGLVLVMGTNAPASLIGFDYARTFNKAELRSSAWGIVNVGAFVSGVAAILSIGFVLGVAGPAHGDPSLGAFKLAFSVQYVIWAVGAVGVVRARAAVRRGPVPHGDVVGAIEVMDAAT
jgi:MFS family permease